MALWNFRPTHLSYGKDNNDATENPDEDGDKEQCPSLEATPAICDPETSGTLKLKMPLDTPSGCKLYPPFTARLYASDEMNTISPDMLIKQFTANVDQEYTFLLEPGTYVVHLSGKYKSEQTLSAMIDRIGIDITGLQFSSTPAPNCITTTPVVINWTGWNDFEINTDPTIYGRSDSGTKIETVPGDYEIKFSRNGCEAISKFKVKNGNPISVQVSGTGWTCAGDGLDGRLRATAQGGTPPYTYAWFSGVGFGENMSWEGPLGFGRTITGLGEGRYMVGVFDSLGCEGTGRGNIEANNNGFDVDVVFTSKAQNIICCQEATTTFATICAIATGGYPPYEYLWTDGQTGVCATGLSQGDHYVTVTDRSGCKVVSDTQEIRISNECLMVKWDFGNGNIQEYLALPQEIYNEVKNPYQLPGNYNVKMMVVNGYQESGIACKNIDVPPCPPLAFIELTSIPNCYYKSNVQHFQYTATLYDADFGVLPGVRVEVRHHYTDTGKAPYNQPGYPLPEHIFNPSCELTPNVISGERQLLTSNEFGQITFDRTVPKCECISLIAKAVDNPVGLVPKDVQSFPLCYRAECPRDPNEPSSSSASPDIDDPDDPGNPPPPGPTTPPPGDNPPPPGDGNPPPPSPPPGDGKARTCCVPQYDGSSICIMMTPQDCAASGGSTQDGSYDSCDKLPGQIIDCHGNKLCREPKGKCCTKVGCVNATPCECEKFGGTYFYNPKGISASEDDCNAYCYVGCCFPTTGDCQTSNAVAVGPTREQCKERNGLIVETCSLCSKSSSSSSSPSPSSASGSSDSSEPSGSSESSNSSDYYA